MIDAISTGKATPNYECLILGQRAYLKVFSVYADHHYAEYHDFHIFYPISGMEDVNITGQIRVDLIEEEEGNLVHVKLTTKGILVAETKLAVNVTECMEFLQFKWCMSLDGDVPGLSTYLMVGGNRTAGVSLGAPAYSKTYGCDEPDEVINAMRLETVRSYKHAFTLPRENFEMELRNYFLPDANFSILGVDTYHGVEAIIQASLFMNPSVSDGFMSFGEQLETLMLDMGSTVLRRATVDFASVHRNTTHFAAGAFDSFIFPECSASISSLLIAFDDFTFRTLIVAPPHTGLAQSASIHFPVATYTYGSLSDEDAKLGTDDDGNRGGLAPDCYAAPCCC